MRKAWLLFSQTVTIAVALLFVVATLKPGWLKREPEAVAVAPAASVPAVAPAVELPPPVRSVFSLPRWSIPSLLCPVAPAPPFRPTTRP